MLTLDPVIADAAALDEARTMLRIDADADDALLCALLASAIEHCEAFTGSVLIARGARQRLDITGQWQRLGVAPVTAITALDGFDAAGAPVALPVEAWRVDIGIGGTGWVRVTSAGAAVRAEVRFAAGLASRWDALPGALRQGIVRLAGHLHAARDGTGDDRPPAAVAALWRPWRRLPFAATREARVP